MANVLKGEIVESADAVLVREKNEDAIEALDKAIEIDPQFAGA